MKINIELFGQLLPKAQRKQTLVFEEPRNVHDIALLLGLQLDEVGLITINGLQSEMEDRVPADCRLCFFPYVSGG